MKSKILSVAALLSMVLFVGIVDTNDAVASDDISIEEVVSVDNIALDLENEIQLFEAGPEYTAMEVCTIAQSFEGDIDHQLIVIQARENTTDELSGYVPYRPRSNLNYSG